MHLMSGEFMEPTLRFRNRVRRWLKSVREQFTAGVADMRSRGQDAPTQRICPSCGLITPRSKRLCLECGKPFKQVRLNESM
jgi:hypothetical protein